MDSIKDWIYYFLGFAMTMFVANSAIGQNLNNNSCLCENDYLVKDFETNFPISGAFRVYGENLDTIIEVKQGDICLDLRVEYDSVYIVPLRSNYIPFKLKSDLSNDTIYIESQAIEFDEVNIYSEERQVELYELGDRSKAVNHYFEFQDTSDNDNLSTIDVKLVSKINNPIQKEIFIKEMYVFLDRVPHDSKPNLQISLYKNDKGKLGGQIIKDQCFDKIDKISFLKKNKGWSKVIFDSPIKLPLKGAFIIIHKINLEANSPYVGMLDVDKEMKTISYSYVYLKGDGYKMVDSRVKYFIKAYAYK